jgi:hypothetical protein
MSIEAVWYGSWCLLPSIVGGILTDGGGGRKKGLLAKVCLLGTVDLRHQTLEFTGPSPHLGWLTDIPVFAAKLNTRREEMFTLYTTPNLHPHRGIPYHLSHLTSERDKNSDPGPSVAATPHVDNNPDRLLQPRTTLVVAICATLILPILTVASSDLNLLARGRPLRAPISPASTIS